MGYVFLFSRWNVESKWRHVLRLLSRQMRRTDRPFHNLVRSICVHFVVSIRSSRILVGGRFLSLTVKPCVGAWKMLKAVNSCWVQVSNQIPARLIEDGFVRICFAEEEGTASSRNLLVPCLDLPGTILTSRPSLHSVELHNWTRNEQV
jgi:hypothetical protein